MGKFKELEGWVALPKAAEQLGLTRQGLHFQVNQGHIPMKYVRTLEMGKRNMTLISVKYVEQQRKLQEVEK